ncbi:hypothetical protein [Haloferula sp.]|uniref:hypothetical protein n=1 Tax=Haloferula sp. TaxID=2497595 RepID=UPI003C707956
MRTFIIIATALCTLIPLRQASADRTAQIVFIEAAPKSPAKTVAHLPDGATLEIELARHNFSESFSMPSGNLELRFLAAALPREAGIPEGAPSVRIPESWKKVILLAVPDPANKVFPARFHAINANPSEWNVGETLFINFTDRHIVGTFGNRTLKLKPKSRVIEKDASNGKSSYPVRLDSANGDGIRSAANPLIRQTWRHYGDLRQLVYFHTAATGSVSYRSFTIHDL